MAEINYKVFNDSVHGHIKMHPLLVKIIDTPQFQRLRNIKQLGGGYYVFPGASHNRFEHSIGVAHLAGKLLESLKKNLPDDPELKIKPKDELCVQIAGLCHDLGHGPFSHLYEDFMKEMKPSANWKHEVASVKMFEDLIEKNGIKTIMENDHQFVDEDFQFIKELIIGPNTNSEWPYEGRDKKMAFLYEIVANHRNGIDVDKMDYLARDCHHLGMKCNFSHERYMAFARVCKENGESQICMRDKEAMNMYKLFHVRSDLHHFAYQHRVTKTIELMIVDAFKEADDHFTLRNGFKISDAADNPEAFVELTDCVLQTILHTQKEELEDAQEITKRIQKRDLYKLLGDKIFEPEELEHMDSAEKWETALVNWLKRIQKQHGGQQPKPIEDLKKDFKAVPIQFNYGIKVKNPIDSLRFYRKDDPNTPIQLSKDEVSNFPPEILAETRVMLFYKGKDKCELTDREIKTYWNELDPFSPNIKDSGIYVDLTGILQMVLNSSKLKLVAAQEIYEIFSQKGFYRFIAEKEFKLEELKHVDSAEQWKTVLEVWLKAIQIQTGSQQLKLTAEDFKVVQYKDKSKSKLYLSFTGLSTEDLEKFWRNVLKILEDLRLHPAPSAALKERRVYVDLKDDSPMAFICQYLATAKEIIKRLLRQGYFIIYEKVLMSWELEYLDSDKWMTLVNVWQKEIQKPARRLIFRAEYFKVVSYHLPCQPEVSKVMLFYKALSEDDIEKFWEQVRRVPKDGI